MLVSGRCFFIHGRSRKNDDLVQAHDGELPSIVPGPQVGGVKLGSNSWKGMEKCMACGLFLLVVIVGYSFRL